MLDYLMQDFVCEIVDVDGQDLFAKCGFQMIEIFRVLNDTMFESFLGILASGSKKYINFVVMN